MQKNLFTQKYIANAPLLVSYYYWILPLAFGYLLFSLLDGYAWNYGLQTTTNILKEVILRIIVSILILLYLLKVINLHVFIICFSLQYLVICSIMLIKLFYSKALVVNLKTSFVSIKFRKQIIALLIFGFSTTIIGSLKIAFDSIVLASIKGLKETAKYAFVGFAASLMQAPFRSIVSVYYPKLVIAWKEKNFVLIDRIYKRSSINLLLFSCFIFGFIWINFENAIHILGLKKSFLDAKWTLFVLCTANVIEMGTGVNTQIIQSSTNWKFEFKTNLYLTFFLIPFTYFFTKQFGLIGPALALLLGYIFYNSIRLFFLFKKYKLLPFNYKTIYALIVAFVCIGVVYFLSSLQVSWWFIIFNNILYSLLFTGAVLYFNLSPDVKPVLKTLYKRWKNFCNKN